MSGSRGPLSDDTQLPTLRTPDHTPPVPVGIDTRLWQQLWTSGVSRAWDPAVDSIVVERYLHALRRWIDAQDELDLLSSPITIGSQGQPVVHPITKVVDQLENRLAQLEKELGLTPMARARLGLTLGSAQLTAEQINKMARR